MKLKLKCVLKLKTDVQEEPVAEDINIVDLPDSMVDEDVKKFFNSLRVAIKKKYVSEIFNYFDVELTQLEE